MSLRTDCCVVKYQSGIFVTATAIPAKQAPVIADEPRLDLVLTGHPEDPAAALAADGGAWLASPGRAARVVRVVHVVHGARLSSRLDAGECTRCAMGPR